MAESDDTSKATALAEIARAATSVTVGQYAGALSALLAAVEAVRKLIPVDDAPVAVSAGTVDVVDERR